MTDAVVVARQCDATDLNEMVIFDDGAPYNKISAGFSLSLRLRRLHLPLLCTLPSPRLPEQDPQRP